MGDPYYSHDTLARAFRSACFTLSLGVLGSSVLPLPYAISKLGVLLGSATMVLVAWTNVATSCMLIRASAHTGRCARVLGWGPRQSSARACACARVGGHQLQAEAAAVRSPAQGHCARHTTTRVAAPHPGTLMRVLPSGRAAAAGRRGPRPRCCCCSGARSPGGLG